MVTRQIPFLHAQQRADGTWAHHWKPSPRLRREGFKNAHLGDTPTRAASAEILAAAMELNDAVAAGTPTAPAEQHAKVYTFGDLVAAYRASDDFRSAIARATQREYNTRLNQLAGWALDGRLALNMLDQQMVDDLKKELLAGGGSIFKAASTLRVLRLLLGWAKAARHIAVNATDGVKIPTPPSRTAKFQHEQMEQCAAAASASGHDQTALAFRVGWWSLQRAGDVRLFNRMAWRTFENLDPRDRPALAGPDGAVKGFRLQQSKTKKWVDCPMPPELHVDIEAALGRSQYLFPHPENADEPAHEKAWQRANRIAMDAAGFADKRYADLRRSGMSWMKDMGALQSNVFGISGHQVLGRKTIVDTYMPPDTLACCAAVAAALRTMATIELREKAK